MQAKRSKRKPPVPIKALRAQGRIRGVGKVLSVQTVRQVERRYKVLEMRRHGSSFQEIAKTLGTTANTVKEDLQYVLGQTLGEMAITIPEDRQLEAERYDALLRRFQPLAESGNLAAAGLTLGISDRRRKLLALDKPEEKHVEETAIRIYVGIDVDSV